MVVGNKCEPNNKNEKVSVSSILDGYKDFILSQGPYKYFITYTSRLNIDADTLLSCVYESIKRANRKLIGKKYNENKDDYFEGFAFLEKHPSGKSKCEYHVHIIVKAKEVLNKLNLKTVISTIKKTINTIKHKTYNVFKKKCIDVAECFDENIIDYCLKKINLLILDFIKTVSNYGIY